MKFFGTLLCAAGLAIAATPAAAQQNQHTIIVGFGAGGGYHGLAVITSRHMGKYLPGKPNIIVQTKPGAGSLVATNYLANVAPKDGTVMGTVSGATVLEALFGNSKAKFDPRTINWLGSAATGHNACFALSHTGVKSLADMKGKEIAVGSTGRGSRTFLYPTALNNLLGTKFKIITGYRGMKDIMQAVNTGEIGGVCGYGWESIRVRHKDLIAQKKINLLAQFAYDRAKDIADVPTAMDVVKPGKERQAMKLLSMDAYLAWPMLAPPGLPKAKLATLREAYDKTMKDPAMIKEAAKIGVDIDPVDGDTMQKTIAEAYALPKDVLDFTRKVAGLKK